MSSNLEGEEETKTEELEGKDLGDGEKEDVALEEEIPEKKSIAGTVGSIVLFASPLRNEKSMREFFARQGYNNVKHYSFHKGHCFLTFGSPDEAQDFVNHFNNLNAEGWIWRCAISNKAVRYLDILDPTEPALHITNYNSAKMTERMLYKLFATHGYIKSLIYHQSHTFIMYDTMEDMFRAHHEMNGFCIDEIPLQVAYSFRCPRPDLSKFVIPLTEIIPRDSKIWNDLESNKFKRIK